MQRAFYTFVVKKIGLSNMPLSHQIVTNHSFCHETCTKLIIYSYYVCKSCSNDHIHFACIIMFVDTWNPYSILLKFYFTKHQTAKCEFEK
jgi:hypothetical protein